jgi:hypothetical protein
MPSIHVASQRATPALKIPGLLPGGDKNFGAKSYDPYLPPHLRKPYHNPMSKGVNGISDHLREHGCWRYGFPLIIDQEMEIRDPNGFKKMYPPRFMWRGAALDYAYARGPFVYYDMDPSLAPMDSMGRFMDATKRWCLRFEDGTYGPIEQSRVKTIINPEDSWRGREVDPTAVIDKISTIMDLMSR